MSDWIEIGAKANVSGELIQGRMPEYLQVCEVTNLTPGIVAEVWRLRWVGDRWRGVDVFEHEPKEITHWRPYERGPRPLSKAELAELEEDI